MKNLIKYPKDTYSEQSIRKALYWLSKVCQWKLDSSGDSWLIELSVTDTNFNECKAELDRLINDFILREELDKKTKHLREKIISAALERLTNE